MFKFLIPGGVGQTVDRYRFRCRHVDAILNRSVFAGPAGSHFTFDFRLCRGWRTFSFSPSKGSRRYWYKNECTFSSLEAGGNITSRRGIPLDKRLPIGLDYSIFHPIRRRRTGPYIFSRLNYSYLRVAETALPLTRSAPSGSHSRRGRGRGARSGPQQCCSKKRRGAAVARCRPPHNARTSNFWVKLTVITIELSTYKLCRFFCTFPFPFSSLEDNFGREEEGAATATAENQRFCAVRATEHRGDCCST